MEALILAAGRGTRMRGVCDRFPKPMLPIANEAMLDITIGHMAAAGVERVFLVVGHCADRIEAHYRAEPGPVPVEFIIQRKAEGTGQAALLGRGPMKEEPFMLAFGDIFVGAETYAGIIRDFRDSAARMALSVRYVEDPWRGAAVYVDDEGFVTRIVEKPPVGTSTTHFDNAGTFCFTPRVWDLLEKVERSPRGEYELTDAIAATLDEGPIKAYEIQGYWLNLTGPEELLRANRLRLEEIGRTRAVAPGASVAGARIGENVSIGEGCVVGPGASLSDAVVLPRARIGAGAVVRHAVIAHGAVVHDNAAVEGAADEAEVVSAGMMNDE